jgi:hypothetical protein
LRAKANGDQLAEHMAAGFVKEAGTSAGAFGGHGK